MPKTEFDTFLAGEVAKVKGTYYPVKAGLLRRIFVRSLPLRRLHPNPNDEFCFPEIGPNYEIMTRYEREFRGHRETRDPLQREGIEPLDVTKTAPDGYMILNGHHRWGAARRIGMDRIPVRICDLTQRADIQKMLDKAGFSRRAVLDLDEVVFCAEGDPCAEKPLSRLRRRIFPERLRKGIPALLYTLNKGGWDIWIYTARYYSLDYLRRYFRQYRIYVTGIVTGTGRKGPAGTDTLKELERILSEKYESSAHIGDKVVLRTFRDSKEFADYPLSGSPETWSREVLDVFDEMKKHEK